MAHSVEPSIYIMLYAYMPRQFRLSIRPSVTRVNCITRKLCYRKDNRVMRLIYGCPENFRYSLTTPTATFLKIL